MTGLLPPFLQTWLKHKKWRLRQHQIAMLEHAIAGKHALLVADTGAGKTLAGFLGSIVAIHNLINSNAKVGLHTLYISPLKALGRDIVRNLEAPIAEMNLAITVDVRDGDTTAAARAKQRSAPPHILVTTPESLSLLLSHPDSTALFADLNTVIIDEVHAFGHEKRGDLLQLSLARLSKINPGVRRVGLSATVANEQVWREWLAPDHVAETVSLVVGEKGADPDIRILTPSGQVPWSGHSANYAMTDVMEIVRSHRSTVIFCNTRGLAELTFSNLWALNDEALPIALHHGSLDRAIRQRAEHAMADGQLRALVATSSVDLGMDWGAVDCVVQMGAPKGASRLIQRTGRSNHSLGISSQAVLIPGNRFEYLEVQAAVDAVKAGERDEEHFRPGALDVLAQHIVAMACAEPFKATDLYSEVVSAYPYRELMFDVFERVLLFASTGGYSLKVYEKYKRITSDSEGFWHITNAAFARQHRMNAGIIVENAMISVRFNRGRRLGEVEEYFASGLMNGDTFQFGGMALEVEKMDNNELIVRATTRKAGITSYTGARMALSTNLAQRVRTFLEDEKQWSRFPADVKNWLELQAQKSVLPRADEILIETFPHRGMHYLMLYPFDGWNVHQSLGMLITKRMEKAGLKPVGFQATDYALGIWSLMPVTDPQPLLSPDILTTEFVDWVKGSHLLRRAFREVAVISGLVDRVHPGQRKNGRQVTMSTDLVFDVLQRYEPDHILLEAAWQDARRRLSDVDRLGALIERTARHAVHMPLNKISPFAVPVLVIIGQERIAGEATEDDILRHIEDLVETATNG